MLSLERRLPISLLRLNPVQYVKICSLYGVGFYYIPGTDMCIKVGGYVRAQAEWGSNNGLTAGSTNPGDFGLSTITSGQFDRTSDNFNFTGRGVLTADARNESEFGTVRGYLRLGGQTTGNGENSTFFVERAFIQFAGLTAGRANPSSTLSPIRSGSAISTPRRRVIRTIMASTCSPIRSGSETACPPRSRPRRNVTPSALSMEPEVALGRMA